MIGKATKTKIVSICPSCENDEFYRVKDEDGDDWYICTECGSAWLYGDIDTTVDQVIGEEIVNLVWESEE